MANLVRLSANFAKIKSDVDDVTKSQAFDRHDVLMVKGEINMTGDSTLAECREIIQAVDEVYERATCSGAPWTKGPRR